MKLIDQIMDLLARVTLGEIEALAPADRERFVYMLRHLANVASVETPKDGVLRDLKDEPRDC